MHMLYVQKYIWPQQQQYEAATNIITFYKTDIEMFK